MFLSVWLQFLLFKSKTFVCNVHCLCYVLWLILFILCIIYKQQVSYFINVCTIVLYIVWDLVIYTLYYMLGPCPKYCMLGLCPIYCMLGPCVLYICICLSVAAGRGDYRPGRRQHPRAGVHHDTHHPRTSPLSHHDRSTHGTSLLHHFN